MTASSSGQANLYGSDGDDIVYGGDFLRGGSGDDTAYGLTGKDVLRGDAGPNTLFGGIGNDTVDGGTGPGTLSGGSGIDNIVMNRVDEAGKLVLTVSGTSNGFVDDGGGGSTGSEIFSAETLSFTSGDGNDTIYVGDEKASFSDASATTESTATATPTASSTIPERTGLRRLRSRLDQRRKWK